MKPAPAQAEPAALTAGQRDALVRLLADDDPAIHQMVRGKILSYGRQAVAWVRPHTLSSDPVLRRRAQEIVQFLARQDSDNRFLGFCLSHGEDLDLEEGIWLLAQTQYPDINVAAYQALLDSYATDIQARLPELQKPAQVLATVNAYLFGDLGFTGNQGNFYDPENSYLNRVIDRRTGNPVSLCAVYWLVGRRLKLPLVGIGMPGHFLCRYQSSTATLFVDAFNRGRLLSRADCVKYLQTTSQGFQEAHLAPMSSGRTLLRMCSHLHQIYQHLSLQEETCRVQRYMVALAK